MPRFVFSGQVGSLCLQHGDGHSELLPQLVMYGAEFADAGFNIDEDVTVIIEDRMIIIVPSSRIGERAACVEPQSQVA